MLLGRRGEQEALTHLLDSVRRGFSATLVLRGEAGIGKTSLLEYAVSAAGDLRVVRVVGIESELELGFAGLHQLVSPFMPVVDRLPPPQRQALESALGLADRPSPDFFLVGLAVLTLLSGAADEGGLLCVVDDAQWLDRSSADVLAFVARRCQADRIGFLFGVREPAERAVALDGLTSVPVRGLDRAAADELLAGLVTGPLDRRVAGQLVERAAGNPLALVELTRELTAEQLAGAAWLPDPLPLAADMQNRFWRRVVALPAQVQELLLLAAAEPTGDLPLFERAAEHLGLGRAMADTATFANLLDLNDRVTFRHPLIRSAVYSGSAARTRRRIHAAIAAVSDHKLDADRVAWHLAAAAYAPDEEIAQALLRSADRAKSRGGMAAGAAYLRRAAELTPDDGRRADRLLAAAEAEFMAGRAVPALAIVDRVGPDLPGPGRRAAAQHLRGAIQFALGDGHQASSTLLQAAQALMPLNPRAARETLLEALVAAFYSGPRAREETLAAIRTTSAGPGGHPSIADLILDGFTALLTDGPIPAVPLLRRGIDALAADDVPDDEALRWLGLGIWAACELFDRDAWYAMATRWVALCREKGALTTLPLALDYLGTWEAFTGRLDAAETTNAAGRDILSATGNPDLLGTRAVELLVPTWRGQDERAREVAARMIHDSVERDQTGGVFYAHFALAVLEISVCDYQAALSHVRVLLDDNGPFFGAIVLPEAVEAAVRCGEHALADLAARRLATRARANGNELVLGLLARCRALTAGKDDSAGLFVEAIGHLERCRAVAELARTHLLYGEWLRRRRRRSEAREQLRIAHRSFEEIGAHRFAERARVELAATGEKARKRTVEGPDQLTVREAQIARLVAMGASNGEVAAQLFISANTVEYHLRHVFQKRGVTSRTMLAATFDDLDRRPS
jgi:DNA-binding CsgD family transcriptional regulator